MNDLFAFIRFETYIFYCFFSSVYILLLCKYFVQTTVFLCYCGVTSQLHFELLANNNGLLTFSIFLDVCVAVAVTSFLYYYIRKYSVF